MDKFEEYLEKYKDRIADKNKYDEIIYPLFHELNELVKERLRKIEKKMDNENLKSLFGKIVVGKISPNDICRLKKMEPMAEINTYISKVSNNGREIGFDIDKRYKYKKKSEKILLFSFCDENNSLEADRIDVILRDIHDKKTCEKAIKMVNTSYQWIERKLYFNIQKNRIQERRYDIPLLGDWWDVFLDSESNPEFDYKQIKSVELSEAVGGICIPIWNIGSIEKTFGSFKPDLKVSPYSLNRARNRYFGSINLSNYEDVLDAYIDIEDNKGFPEYFYSAYDSLEGELKIYTDERHISSQRLKVNIIYECGQDNDIIKEIKRFDCLDTLGKYAYIGIEPSKALIYDIVYAIESLTGLQLNNININNKKIEIYLHRSEMKNYYVEFIEEELKRIFPSYEIKGVIENE